MTESIISFQGVSFKREGTCLLSDVHWRTDSGQHWAILGSNGSGKSLLLKMVSGYLFPTDGRVSILGRKFGECDLRELRRSIGWVSLELQFLFPTTATVQDVVTSGLSSHLGVFTTPRDEDTKKVAAMLEEFQLSSCASRIFRSLSYGEQKRALLARALISQPSILILDEPCTGLDIRARERFLELLEQRVLDNQTLHVLYTSHHADEIMPFITHLLTLKNGEISASGPKKEVLSSKLLSNLFDFPVMLHHNAMQDRYSVEHERGYTTEEANVAGDKSSCLRIDENT
ncbi:ATP-binding cassette domain-containing protein [bacterium]|nr:ATP-binding cassette domain-containing protein [bacterium]